MDPLEHAALSGALTSPIQPDSPDPDGREPSRADECSIDKLLIDDDEADECGMLRLSPNDPSGCATSSQAMSRGWSGNTGPKGVLLDFKASHGKSGAILGGHNTPQSSYRRQLAMSSALVPAISGRRSSPSSGSDSELSDKDNRRSTRLTISSSHHRKTYGSSPSNSLGPPGSKPSNVDSRGKKLFGHLREVGVENFIQAVEAEKDDKETVVLIHLYDPALESCVILNTHLSNLARTYPRIKFLRALASELDFFNASPSAEAAAFALPNLSPSPRASFDTRALIETDPFGDDSHAARPPTLQGEEQRPRRATDSDVLPTLIWYRAGEYVQSLPALERELPTGLINRGEKGCKEVVRLLSRYGIISQLELV